MFILNLLQFQTKQKWTSHTLSTCWFTERDEGWSIPSLLSEGIISISFGHVPFLQITELKEMRRSVVFMVVVPWHTKLYTISHADSVLHSHKVVIPGAIVRSLRIHKSTKKRHGKSGALNHMGTWSLGYEVMER